MKGAMEMGEEEQEEREELECGIDGCDRGRYGDYPFCSVCLEKIWSLRGDR